MTQWYVTQGSDKQGDYWRYNRNGAGEPADELDEFTFTKALQILNRMYGDVFPSKKSNVIICRGAI